MPIINRDRLRFVELPGRRSADPLADLDTASSLRIVELESDPARSAHRHPHSEEVVVVLSGSGRVWIEGRFTPVVKGDVVVVGRGDAHATIPDEPMRLACFFPHPNLGENLEETSVVIRLAEEHEEKE